MHVVLKTLNGEKTDFEVTPYQSVASLKTLVQQRLGHDPALTKLILLGRILEDGQLLGECSVKEGDQIVLMVNKAKAPVVIRPQPEQGEGSETDEARRLFEQNVARIQEMGFDRASAEQNLRTALNNPERAIELLMSADLPAADQDLEEDEEPAEDNPLAFLLANESFLQARDMIRSDPSVAPGLLAQLNQQDPDLARLIQENPEAFQRLVQDPLPEDEGGDAEESRPEVLGLTEADRTAINELMSLGFNEDDVLEAYFSCEKNQEMAANLLFENYQAVPRRHT